MLRSFSQKFVEFPDTIKVGITAVIVWVVLFAVNYLIGILPFLAFLLPFVNPIALSVAAALVLWLQNALPGEYPEVSLAAIKLILLVLTALGIGNGVASLVPSLSFMAF
jgi:hypothetical protein